MKKSIARLQYISQSIEDLTQTQAVEAACKAGCKWIQLRVKGQKESVVMEVAQQAKIICQSFGATFIINDYPSVAKAIGADGVHLGLTDFSHQEARKLLGDNFIIGGTANTMEHIRNYAQQGVVDYLGVGPFRFTTTKEKLSPILGVDGYKMIVEQCKKEQITLPIVAIGGIQLDDILSILQTGVYGIAAASLITKAINKNKVVHKIYSVIDKF